jgi:hypothetical protein
MGPNPAHPITMGAILRASPIGALKFGAVKVVCSALNPDIAHGVDASFTGGSILQRNQEEKNSPLPEDVK